MLVLSRKQNETIQIIDSTTGTVVAEVTVVQIRGTSVRLGLTADTRFRVLRKELTTAPEPHAPSLRHED